MGGNSRKHSHFSPNSMKSESLRRQRQLLEGGLAPSSRAPVLLRTKTSWLPGKRKEAAGLPVHSIGCPLEGDFQPALNQPLSFLPSLARPGLAAQTRSAFPGRCFRFHPRSCLCRAEELPDGLAAWQRDLAGLEPATAAQARAARESERELPGTRIRAGVKLGPRRTQWERCGGPEAALVVLRGDLRPGRDSGSIGLCRDRWRKA